MSNSWPLWKVGEPNQDQKSEHGPLGTLETATMPSATFVRASNTTSSVYSCPSRFAQNFSTEVGKDVNVNILGRGSQRTRESVPRAWTHPAEAWKSSRSTGLFILILMVMNSKMVVMAMNSGMVQ